MPCRVNKATVHNYSNLWMDMWQEKWESIGSYLDPLADKVLIGCVGRKGRTGCSCCDARSCSSWGCIRANNLGSKSRSWSEFLNLDGISPQKVEPLMISKVNTCFQLALVTGALLQPEFGTQETESYITYLSWLVASTTMAYGRQYLKSRSMFIHRCK